MIKRETPNFMVGFFGVPGTSKSSIADYASLGFGLGILRSDSVRFEVKEDLRVESLKIQEDLNFEDVSQNGALEEYERRLQRRLDMAFEAGRPFIFDGSMDRRWPSVRPQLAENGFESFMINMELSPGFLERLYIGTGRDFFLPQLPDYLADHAKFREQYSDDISIEISDEIFPDRLQFAGAGLHKFIETLKVPALTS